VLVQNTNNFNAGFGARFVENNVALRKCTSSTGKKHENEKYLNSH
jgi:hypothetical protein